MLRNLRRGARVLMWLSVAITFAALSRETARDYLFTLIALILGATALPYVLALAAMRRLPGKWATATGLSTCLFGLGDAAWRVQAFFFPTLDSGGGMAVWLPIYGLAAIPFFAVIAHTFLTAFRPVPDGHPDGETSDPGAQERRPPSTETG